MSTVAIRNDRSSSTPAVARQRSTAGFYCRSVTIAPLAPYVPKAKSASECSEVPLRGSNKSQYLIIVIDFSDCKSGSVPHRVPHCAGAKPCPPASTKCPRGQ